METRAISFTIDGYTSNQYIDARIVWTSLQDNDANTSKVTATLQYRRTNTGYTTDGTGTFSITINGKTTSVTKYLKINTEWVTAIESTVTVAHDSDGSKSISISGEGSIPGTSLVSTFVSGKVTLPTIPRASTLNSLSCATAYFNGEMTYKYTPYSESFYNRCNISLNLDGEYIAVKSIYLGRRPASKQTEAVTLSKDELATIYKKLPSTTNGILRFTLRTYSDSNYSSQIGDVSYKELTLYIEATSDTKPTATMTLSPLSALDSPLNTLYIKGRSKVDANFTDGEGKYDAEIVSYKMVVGGKSYGSPYTSEYLSTEGKVDVKGMVKDTRGFEREYTETITVLPYDKPKLLPASDESAIICARCDADGNLSDSGTHLKIKAKRSYYNVAVDDVQNNFCDIRYRCIPEGTKFTGDEGWVTLLEGNTTSTDTVDENLSGVVSSTNTAYIVQVGVIDDLGESDVLQFVIPTDFITVDIPEEHKGRRIGFFRYVDETEEDGAYFGLPIFGGFVDSLKIGTVLAATETAPIDLNDVTTPGCYYSPGNSYSQYISNTPYTDGGFGLIVREIQSVGYIRQEIYHERTNWCRHWNGSEWSGWLRTLPTSIGSGTVEDFVIASGTFVTDCGTWHYKRWAGGTYQMFGYFDVAPTELTKNGSVYRTNSITIRSPFEISSACVSGSVMDYCWISNGGISSDHEAVAFRLIFANEIQPNTSINVRLMVMGNYK